MSTDNQTPSLKQIEDSLSSLLAKRKGGAINFRGIHYQLLYSCSLILQNLHGVENNNTIQLEGLEDIDLHSSKITYNESTYIQLKSSQNRMDAGSFWDLEVLQNFIDVYKINSNLNFKLVYNMKVAKGNLSELISRTEDQETSKFWTDKLNTSLTNERHLDFLNKVSFEYQSKKKLYDNIIKSLYEIWGINIGTETQFLRSLFYNVLIWSEERKVIDKSDIHGLFQEIKDSYSKEPTNNAIRNNWINKVSYETQNSLSEGYFAGKAARPSDIAMGLPIRRKKWERQIQENLDNWDVTVIKSSSGQGKSTLAWQVGFNLKDDSAIYQLHACRDVDEANSIIEFLESRLIIGEKPIVIIDGLNSLQKAWPEILKKSNNAPVKYVITTRQEDWFRFGADISRINLSIIDIFLSIEEAKDIFNQFKRKDRLHDDIPNWQSVWEQLDNKGLLIEYTYLLTKGQMISERLSTQLKYINETKSSAAKVEILRIVSLADCLNIRVKTRNLIGYIKSEIGFENDRGEIINELEKEYFLNFEDEYIEGLHPVRSGHLKDLLHKNLPIEDSLINLYKILDDFYRLDFFIHSTLFVTTNGKKLFYEKLANELYNDKITNMVYALDGIMHSEPLRYYSENKPIFDKAYELGGIDLFAGVTTPFSDLDTFESLANIMGDKGGNLQNLANLKNELPPYIFENTDILHFGKALSKSLKKRDSRIDSYEGLEFLVKWFKILEINLTITSITTDIHVDDLVQMDVQEAKEYMLYFQINDPKKFQKFVSKNKSILTSYLKVETNSLTIGEKESDIHINYLLFANEVDKANEFSMFRISVIYAFFPFYKHYCTEAILLPFPTEKVVSVVKMNSTKKMPVKNVSDSFEIHLNQIWSKTILKNYQENSVYEWQKNIINIREICLDWSITSSRMIDSLCEGNLKKKEKSAKHMDKVRGRLNEVLKLNKTYPIYRNQEPINEEATIKSWFASMRNVNNQFLNIFSPEEPNFRNVAVINLKSVCFDLNKMQIAFKEVEDRTFSYFDSDSISKKENEVYGRLLATVLYYLSQIPLEEKTAVKVGKIAVNNWWEIEKSRDFNELLEVLDDLERDYGYNIIKPTKIEKTKTYNTCTFGIADFDFSDLDAISNLSMDLTSFAHLPFEFVSIISIQNNEAIGGFRFKKRYFQAFLNVLLDDEDIYTPDLEPLMIPIDDEVLNILPNLKQREPTTLDAEKENLVKIGFEVWKLSEFKKRLNQNSKIEQEWQISVEKECKLELSKCKSVIDKSSKEFKKLINDTVEDVKHYSQQEIVDQIYTEIQTTH